MWAGWFVLATVGWASDRIGDPSPRAVAEKLGLEWVRVEPGLWLVTDDGVFALRSSEEAAASTPPAPASPDHDGLSPVGPAAVVELRVVEPQGYSYAQVSCADGTRVRGTFADGRSVVEGLPLGDVDCRAVLVHPTRRVRVPVRAGGVYQCAHEDDRTECVIVEPSP